MKKITLSLSDAQARRLKKLARLLKVTPEKLATVELFNAFDAEDGGNGASGFLETWPDALETYGRGVSRCRSSFPSLESGLAASAQRAPDRNARRRKSPDQSVADLTKAAVAIAERDLDFIKPKFNALVYYPSFRTDGMPSDEAGPTLLVEGPHNLNSALHTCGTWLRAFRQREMTDARAFLVTDGLVDKQALSEALKQYVQRYPDIGTAGECLRDIEVHRVEEWTSDAVTAAVRRLAPGLENADQLMIFSLNHDVLPGITAAQAADHFMHEAFDDSIARAPARVLSWSRKY